VLLGTNFALPAQSRMRPSVEMVTTCHGKKLAAGLQGALGGVFQPAAAGYLHAHDGNFFYVVVTNDFFVSFSL